MRIGIDLDNTIINYNLAFFAALTSEKKFKSFTFQDKQDLKKKIINKKNGSLNWQKLQGKVYGKYIFHAQLMLGFERFLNLCKIRNHEVYIVSHKTTFGHYDNEKIPLREVAIQFLKKKKLFDVYKYNLKYKNIYFAESKSEKIKIINSLNLQYFIDDLFIILSDKNIEKDINKILIGHYSKKINNPRIICKSNWEEISNHIYKHINFNDLKFYTNLLNIKDLVKYSKINKGINSKVYKIISSNNKKYILKIYPKNINNNNFTDRGINEYSALKYLNIKNLKSIPIPVSREKYLDICAYSWIEGKKNKSFKAQNLINLIIFIKKLKKISASTPFKKFNFASESSNNILELLNVNKIRIYKLKKFFISRDFSKLIKKIEDLNIKISKNIIQAIKNKKIEPILKKKNLILSPSDISLSNIISDGKKDYYIDFEYFGWDDPCKLISDLLWHPKNKISNDKSIELYQNLLAIFSDDKEIYYRFNLSFNLYGVKWSLIMLNMFTKTNPQTIRQIMSKSSKNNIFVKQIRKCNKTISYINDDRYLKFLKINEIK